MIIASTQLFPFLVKKTRWKRSTTLTFALTASFWSIALSITTARRFARKKIHLT